MVTTQGSGAKHRAQDEQQHSSLAAHAGTCAVSQFHTGEAGTGRGGLLGARAGRKQVGLT